MLAHREQLKWLGQTGHETACSWSAQLIRCSKSVPIRASDMSARGCHLPPGLGATMRILFESRPLFPVHPGATNQPVIELDDGVGFLWVRE